MRYRGFGRWTQNFSEDSLRLHVTSNFGHGIRSQRVRTGMIVQLDLLRNITPVRTRNILQIVIGTENR